MGSSRNPVSDAPAIEHRTRADVGCGVCAGAGGGAHNRSKRMAALGVCEPAERFTDTATYMDIWKDAIDRNNRDYRARGDERSGKGNAPAIEAHFVIWSPRRSVVLSILDTAIACSVKAARPEARATVKLCPMRIAIYDGLLVETMDGGQACFLELEWPPATDPAASAAYASYDIATKTIRIGMILNHSPVEGCSVDVPLQQR